ncbi:MAG: transglutaminase [Candidatus Marinimicrobia bacterium]|nr:transglutaminase [Candidatus Neomarinimicrobiota bacterium]
MITEAKNIFDTEAPLIRELIEAQGWQKKNDTDKLGAILDYVKNDILFGMNNKGCLPASEVLRAGQGQALTKSILLKTLIDACGLLCRFHAYRVKKELYEGLPGKFRYRLLPDTLISAWIEVFHNDRWIVADGVLLDEAYLKGLSSLIDNSDGEFIGLGAGIYPGNNQVHSWDGKHHSYSQRAAITRDLGIIDDLDWFFSEFRSDFRDLGKIGSRHANRRIAAIRQSK